MLILQVFELHGMENAQKSLSTLSASSILSSFSVSRFTVSLPSFPETSTGEWHTNICLMLVRYFTISHMRYICDTVLYPETTVINSKYFEYFIVCWRWDYGVYVCVCFTLFFQALSWVIFVIMLAGAVLQYPHTYCYSKQKMALLGQSTLCIINYRKSYISYIIPNWNSIIYFCIFYVRICETTMTNYSYIFQPQL